MDKESRVQNTIMYNANSKKCWIVETFNEYN